MMPLPNMMAPLVNKIGRLLPPWNSYLQQFTQAPPAFNNITVGASPFSYVAKEPGNLIITGGTVSAVVLTRALVSINVAAARIVPVGIDDVVTITYSALPTIRFIPSYGQNLNV